MTRETRKRELEIGIGLVLYLLAFLISMQAKMKSKAEMLLFLLPYIVSAISIYKEQAEKFLKKQFLDENLLMIIATVGAFFVGRYKEAVAAMLFYQVGKLVEEIKQMKYDMLTFSAHKLQGPQGIGVLVLRKKGYRLPPVKGIMYGGQQEHGIRPGTIPVALVAGCGRACEIAAREYAENKKKTEELKKIVMSSFDESGLEYHINGDKNYCISSTVNICIPGVMSEALMISTKKYCSISNGSACTSKSYSPSYVLSAMGVPENEIECSVRISWGPDTSSEELVYNLKQLIEVARQIKQ